MGSEWGKGRIWKVPLLNALYLRCLTGFQVELSRRQIVVWVWSSEGGPKWRHKFESYQHIAFSWFLSFTMVWEGIYSNSVPFWITLEMLQKLFTKDIKKCSQSGDNIIKHHILRSATFNNCSWREKNKEKREPGTELRGTPFRSKPSKTTKEWPEQKRGWGRDVIKAKKEEIQGGRITYVEHWWEAEKDEARDVTFGFDNWRSPETLARGSQWSMGTKAAGRVGRREQTWRYPFRKVVLWEGRQLVDAPAWYNRRMCTKAQRHFSQYNQWSHLKLWGPCCTAPRWRCEILGKGWKRWR